MTQAEQALSDDSTAILPRQRGAGNRVEPADAPTRDAETALLPKQTAPIAEPSPKVSAWEATPRGVAPVEGDPAGRERALGTLAWVFAALITAALGMVRLNWASMHTQELRAWRFTGVPWRQVPHLLGSIGSGDVPYYLLLHAWSTAFGRSDFALRIPSVAAMAGAAALVSILGTRLVRPQVGALAGLLMAVLPVTTRYAQETGPQALLLFAAALATVALIGVLDWPRPSRFVGYAAAVALLGLSNVIGLLIVVVHGVVVLAMRRPALLGWLAAALGGVAPSVVLLVYAGVMPWSSSVTSGTTPALPSLTDFAAQAFGMAILGGAVFGLAVLAISGRKPAIVFSAWAVLPLLALYPIVRYTSITSDQLAVLVAPAWVGVAALGLSRSPVARGVVALAAVAAIGVPAQVAIRGSDGHGAASHRLAEVLYTEAQPGDGIVFGPATGDGPAGRAMVERYLSAGHRPKDLLAQPNSAGPDGWHVRECPDVKACLGSTSRVWLVRVGDFDSPLTGLEAGKDGALRVRYEVKRDWKLTGVTLTLFTLKSAS